MPAQKKETQSVAIPVSARSHESRLIPAPIEKTWAAVRPLTFKWNSIVKSVKVEGGEGEVGSLRTVTYKDNTVQTLKVLELSDLDYSITYEMITSVPALTVSSAIYTIKLRRVTFDNNDATVQEIEDSKYKKLDGFKDLIEFLNGGKKKAAAEPAVKSPAKKAKK